MIKQFGSFIILLFALISPLNILGICADISPSLSITTTSYCDTNSHTITPTNNSTGTGISTALYYWKVNGNPYDTTYGLASPSGYTITSQGTYNFSVTAVDTTLGCTEESSQIIVTNNKTPLANFSHSTDLCSGDPIAFSNSSTNISASTTYLWNFGDGNSSTLSDPNHTFITSNSFNASLSATENGCTTTKTIHLQVALPPTVGILVDQDVCLGELFTATSNSTNVSGTTTYLWDFGDGTTASSSSVNYVYGTSGTQNLKLTVTNGTCSKSDSLTVTIHNKPSILFNSSNNYCVGETVSFTESSSNTHSGSTYLWDFGDGTTSNAQNPTHSFNNNTLHSIKLIVSNGGSCKDSITQNVQVELQPSANANWSYTPNDSCLGTTVSFTGAATNTTSNTGYSWDFGNGSQDMQQNTQHTYSSSALYEVIFSVINSATCIAKDTQKVLIKDIPTISISGDDGDGDLEYCLTPADFNTTNTVTFSNNTTNAAMYTWDFGDGSPLITTTSPANLTHTYTTYGTFQVLFTATNASGCSRSDTLEVIFQKFIIANLNIPVTEVAGCVPHTINPVNLSQSASTFVWDWGDGTKDSTTNFTAPPHTYMQPGVSFITLTVYNSCNSSNTVVGPIFISDPPTASFTKSLNTRGCAPQQVSFTNQSTGATPGFNYRWNMGNGNTYTNVLNPPDQTYIKGNYNISLIAINSCGADTITKSIAIDTVPMGNLYFPPSEGCTPLTIEDSSIIDGGNLSYLWKLDNVAVGTDDTLPNQTLISNLNNTPTNYAIELNINNQCGSTTLFDTAIVHPQVFTEIQTIIDTSCTQDNYTLQDSTTGTNLIYQWNFANSNTSNSPGPVTTNYSSTGTYNTQLIVSGYCGKDTTTLPIIVVAPPTAQFQTIKDTFCAIAPIIFTNNSQGATNYLWDFGDGNTSTNQNPTYTYNSAGSYWVKLTAFSSICNRTDSSLIVINPLPTPDFTFSNACQNDSITFTNTTAGSVTNPIWNFGDGNNSSLENPKHAFTSGNNYTVTFTISNNLGCTDSVQKNVTIYKLPTADFTLPLTCENDSARFTNQSSANSTSWDWTFLHDNTTYSGVAPTIWYGDSGSYSVSLLVSTANGCKDSTIKTLFIDSIPEAKFLVESVCTLDSLQILNQSSPTPLNYLWDFGDGNTSSATNPGHAYSQPNTYTISLTSSFNNGCQDTTSHTIEAYTRTNPGFTVPFNCIGDSLLFTDTTSLGTPNNWAWDFDDGNTSSDQHPKHLFANDGNYNVQLITKNIYGCKDTTNQTIKVFPYAVAQFTSDSVCANIPTSFTNTSMNSDNWTWDFGNSNSSTDQNPQNIYTQDGSYLTTLIATNAAGCKDTISDSVYVFGNPIADFTARDTCFGFPTVINDQSHYTLNWLWEFGDGNTSNSPSPSHQYLTDGTFSIKLLLLNGSGCEDSITKNVTVHPRPIIDFGFNQTCLKDSMQLSDLSTESPTAWTWVLSPSDSSFVETPKHVFTTPGSHPVTLHATSPFGCIDSLTKNVYVDSIPQIGFTVGPACLSDSIRIQNTSTITPINMSWDFGDGNTSNAFHPAHQFSLQGTYTITANGTYPQNGCSDTISQVVSIFPLTSPDFISDTICLNDSTSFSDLSGGSPTNWFWNFGDGNNSTLPSPKHLYTTQGTYNVQLSTSTNNGCKDSTSKNVIVLALPTAKFSVDTVCHGLTTTLLDLSNDAISWNWNIGDNTTSNDTNISHTYSLPGVYPIQLIVQNNVGCSDTLNDSLLVRTNPTAGYTYSQTCLGMTTYFTNTSSLANSWDWTFSQNNAISSDQNPTYLYNTADSFEVTLSIIDGFTCKDTITQTISVLPKPTANFKVDTVCAHNHSSFTNLSSTNSTVWNWTFDNSNLATDQHPTYTFPDGGSYYTTLIVETALGCKDTISDSVYVREAPTPSFVADTVCHRDSTKFISSNISSYPINEYYWDFSDGNHSFSKDPAYIFHYPGTYNVSLTATNDIGCDSTYFFPIIVNQLPEVNFINDSACLGAPTHFTDISSDSPNQWDWSFGDGGISSDGPNTEHTYSSPGSYLVTLTVTSGTTGCMNDTSKQVAVLNTVIAQINTYQVACANNPVQFVNQTIINSGTLLDTLWTFGDGNTSTEYEPIHTYLQTGNYTIKLLVTSSSGCQSIDTMDLVVNDSPITQFDIQNLCEKSAVLFTDSSTTQIGNVVEWEWDFDDGTLSTLQHPTHHYAQAGNYQITLSVTSDSGCTSQHSENITINPRPIANFTSSTECFGDPTFFIDQSTVASGNIGGIIWNFNDSTTSNHSNPQHVFTDLLGSETTLIAVSNLGCTDTVSKNINFHPIPDFDFFPTATSGCEGLTIDLINNTTITGSSINNVEWSFGDGSASFDPLPTHTYDTAGEYNITLSVTTAENCYISDTLSAPIKVFPIPDAGFLAEPNTVSMYDPTIDFINTSEGATTYSWYFNDGYSSTEYSPTKSFSDTATYQIELVAISNFGCKDTVYKPVIVYGEYALFIPNSFSPNGDGLNDRFQVKGFGIVSYHIRIFDRWGEDIYESVDMNKQWDGQKNGKDSGVDQYIYNIITIDIFGKEHVLDGRFNLIR